MRLFLAIELPDDVRAQLGRWRDRLKSNIAHASFTRGENLHITLKFLGEVEAARLDELQESLAHIRTGAAIEIFAEGIECFPKRGPVRILAAGFAGDLAGIRALHASVEQRCQHLGFEREEREYRPHVTLARARPVLPSSLRLRVSEVATDQVPPPPFAVREFVLMQSHLGHEGSRYEVLSRFSLEARQ